MKDCPKKGARLKESLAGLPEDAEMVERVLRMEEIPALLSEYLSGEERPFGAGPTRSLDISFFRYMISKLPASYSLEVRVDGGVDVKVNSIGYAGIIRPPEPGDLARIAKEGGLDLWLDKPAGIQFRSDGGIVPVLDSWDFRIGDSKDSLLIDPEVCLDPEEMEVTRKLQVSGISVEVFPEDLRLVEKGERKDLAVLKVYEELALMAGKLLSKGFKSGK